ncbi:MAG TPA: hypothetical protein VFR97_01530 [Capillimicrobium sp.]|nr:hypothetical protein [Capillimicrobium sp.]
MRLLLAFDAFGPELDGPTAGAAIARGLAAAGLEPPDVAAPAEVGDARLRAAFALVIGEAVLDRGTLEGRLTGELAVRARQAGVPCHAIAASVRLDPFDGRILDLQHMLQAGTVAELERAGRDLGELLRAEVLPGERRGRSARER